MVSRRRFVSILGCVLIVRAYNTVYILSSFIFGRFRKGENPLDMRAELLYDVYMKKDLTAVRLRPEQVEELRKLAQRDKETSISSLIRTAVDEFILRAKKKK